MNNAEIAEKMTLIMDRVNRLRDRTQILVYDISDIEQNVRDLYMEIDYKQIAPAQHLKNIAE